MTTLENRGADGTVNESLDPRDPLLRLSTFFDDGSLALLHERDRSGVLAATGTVNGVKTVAFCTDGTVMGGAMGVEGCQHIVNAYDTAIEESSPIIGIWHSGGARLAEGVRALHAVGLVFEAMIRASGFIPQISVVVGFAAGGAAYGPALTDVVIMAPEGRVFVTGPDVVRSVTGEDVDMASLGGPDTHHKKSGVCHIVADDELDAYARGRRLVGYFCQQGHFDRSKAEAGEVDLKALLPESARRAYDVHPLTMARRLEAAGAGEILLQSVDRDGTMVGYDLATVAAVAEAVAIPVIASGGCGTYGHMVEALEHGASALAAA